MRSRVGIAVGFFIVKLVVGCIVERRIAIGPAAHDAAEGRAGLAAADLEPDVDGDGKDADTTEFFRTGSGYQTQSATRTVICHCA